MNTVFFIAGAVALLAAGLAVFQRNAIHALLDLVVSFIGLGIVFFVLGAPFAAVLEVIIYAGAIMVLFVFVIMMFNVKGLWSQENGLLRARAWAAPGILASVLAAELVYVIWSSSQGANLIGMVGPKAVSLSLFGPYVLAVELASFVLLAGLVGAYHLAHRIGRSAINEGKAS